MDKNIDGNYQLLRGYTELNHKGIERLNEIVRRIQRSVSNIQKQTTGEIHYGGNRKKRKNTKKRKKSKKRKMSKKRKNTKKKKIH